MRNEMFKSANNENADSGKYLHIDKCKTDKLGAISVLCQSSPGLGAFRVCSAEQTPLTRGLFVRQLFFSGRVPASILFIATSIERHHQIA